MHAAAQWLDVLFGKGDTDYPFWLLTVRVNILLFVLCAAAVIAWNLSAARLRRALEAKREMCTVLVVTAVAAVLRFVVTSANLMDHGGIAYSRLLLGYKGYFGTAQFFSLFYGFTARDIEHAILFNRIAGTLTIPLVYMLCRGLQPGATLLPATAALLFAVYPLHILFSASDALAVFSCFLAAASYALLVGAVGLDGDKEACPSIRPLEGRGLLRVTGQLGGPLTLRAYRRGTAGRTPTVSVAAVHYLGGFAGLALLTQVRYENVLLLIPPALILFTRRHALRLRPLVPSLVVLAVFIMIYAYEAATGGVSYQKLVNRWESLQTVESQLVLNPFVAVPVLFIGTVALRAYKGPGLGDLALLPWLTAFTFSVLTIDSGHSAARVYANWLILILPLAGYGFYLMVRAGQWVAKAVAAAALLYLGLQPFIMHDRLAAQYLEIVENDRFRALLTSPPPGTKWIIVPDDDILRRQAHSTLEVFTKYAMIRAGSRDGASRAQLVGLTEYLEHPQQTACAPGACVFFFGLPCAQQDLYPFTPGQCAELLRTRRTSIVEETAVVTAPFVYCSIYTGALWKRLCDPVTKAQRFTVYRIEE